MSRWSCVEAVLHTPDTRGVHLVGDENDVGPPAMVRIGLLRRREEEEEEEGGGEGEGEEVVLVSAVNRERRGDIHRERRDDDGAAAANASSSVAVCVSVRPNIRRLNWGAEVEVHLHGEAPDATWFRGEEGLFGDGGEGDGYWNVAEDDEAVRRD